MRRLFTIFLLLFTIFLSLLGLIACSPPAEPVPVTRITAEAITATQPPATATAVMQPTAVPANATGEGAHTATPEPLPTSELVSGWLQFNNADYGYTISYPPEVEIVTQGVTGFPTDELPEGMTESDYLQQLKETYSEMICVSFKLDAGSLIIAAPEDKGGRYASPCGGLGIGAYDTQDSTDTIEIDGRVFTAKGLIITDRGAGQFRSEFYRLELDDGTMITYVAGPEFDAQFETDYQAAYDAYSDDKTTLNLMLGSFRSETALSLAPPPNAYVISEPPIFEGGEARLMGWSENGRYLAYFEHTQEQLDASQYPGGAEGTFTLFDTATQEKCQKYAISGMYAYEGPGRGAQQIWLPESDELLIYSSDGTLWQVIVPCEEDVALTAVIPEPIQYFHGVTPDKTRVVIAGETRYWLYDWQTQSAMQIPEVTPSHFNNLVWSPNGAYLAITLEGNTTGNRDPIGGSRVVEMASGEIVARHDWEPANALDGTFGGPVWLDNQRFVVTLSLDQGPFFMSVDGQVESVLPLFGLENDGNVIHLFAYADSDSDQYHLLLTDWGGQFDPIPPQIYHSASGEVEFLGEMAQESPLLTADGQLSIYRDGDYWSRPIGAVGEQPSRNSAASCVRPWDLPRGELSYLDGDLFKVEGCQFLTAVSPPTRADRTYGRISPDDQWLALLVNETTLYVVGLDFLE